MTDRNPNKLFKFEVGTLTPHGIMIEAFDEILYDIVFLKNAQQYSPATREFISKIQAKMMGLKEIYQGNNEKMIKKTFGNRGMKNDSTKLNCKAYLVMPDGRHYCENKDGHIGNHQWSCYCW